MIKQLKRAVVPGYAARKNAQAAAAAAAPAVERAARITLAFTGTYLNPVHDLLTTANLTKLVFSSTTAEVANTAPKEPNIAIMNRITSNDALYAQIKAVLQTPFPATRADGANAAARNVPDGTFPFNNPVSDESVMQMLSCMYGEKETKDCTVVAGTATWYFYYPLKNKADITVSACFKALLAPIIGLAPVEAAAVADRDACGRLAQEHELQMSEAERAALQGMEAEQEGPAPPVVNNMDGGRRPKGRKTRGKRHPKRRGSRRH